jgi:hypothetical protein
VEAIVAYCTERFPRTRLWLNPVVAGEGLLRTGNVPMASPDYLWKVRSPNLLTPDFFRQGARKLYETGRLDWGCKAGTFFFDIKPNGDFWICQDFAPPTRLNILDHDFPEKLQNMDFSETKKSCSGCTYSCYYITQLGFEPRYWPQIATMWWKSNTEPSEPCRQVAERYGWFSGLLYFAFSRLLASTSRAAATAMLLLILFVPMAWGQPAVALLNRDEVISRMEQTNARRQETLESYRCQRRYMAENQRLHKKATLKLEMNYQHPDEKQFQILERNGSQSIINRVFFPMLESEQKNARLPARLAVDINRTNYRFTFIRYDSQRNAYQFEVSPLVANKYLFKGDVWIDPKTFGIMRIEGEPAQPVSFWVKRVHFIHEYDAFGDYYFPVKHRTQSELRIFGRSTVEIDYYDYRWANSLSSLSNDQATVTTSHSGRLP